MNAFELYDACFDSANDYAEATAAYVSEYAHEAMGIAIGHDVAEMIALKKREWDSGRLGEGTDDFWHGVEKPLSAIEI